MVGGTIARTAHFALHFMRFTLSDALPSDAPASAGTGPASMAQNHPQGTLPSRPLFGVSDVWMGAMVPKRWAKRAVTRNAIKRQILNAGAVAEPLLKPAAHVVRLRASFDKAAYPSATSDALKSVVRHELAQLFANATSGTQQSDRAAL